MISSDLKFNQTESVLWTTNYLNVTICGLMHEANELRNLREDFRESNLLIEPATLI